MAFERNTKIWFGWLAEYDSVYHLGTTADAVERVFYTEQDTLRQKPAGGIVGPDEWADIFLYAGYYQQTWLELGAAFAGWVHDGDAATLVAEHEDFDFPGEDNGFAVYNAVQCTDVQWPRSWQQWRRDHWRTYRIAPFFRWGNAWYNAPCLFWAAIASTPIKIDGSRVAVGA